jgi:hypothetical protein
MAMNRVQFQRGLSMAEFMEQYGTEAQCEAALIASHWPQGFVCPACAGPASCSFRRQARLYWQCAWCRHQCSVTSGTIFESTKLPLTRWFLAMHLLTQAKNNVSALELKRHLGVSYPTAWLVKHKLLEVMRLREDSRRLTGRVEIDDAYLGGERSGGKTGRGSRNKVPFIAAVQTTEDGQPVLACFAQRPFTKQAVEEFAATSLVRPLTVVSDGLWCFTAAAAAGVHELDGGIRRPCWPASVRCSALHRQPGHRSDARCAASDSISALLRLAKSGSGFAAVPCDRVPPRISCNDQTV